MKTELITRLNELYKVKGDFKVYFKAENGIKDIVRIGMGRNGVMVMAKNSKTKGYTLNEYTCDNVIDIEPIREKPIETIWLNSIDKAINLLNKSNLWVDLKNNIILAKEIGFDTLNKAYSIYNEYNSDLTYDESKKQRIERIKALEPRLMLKDDIINTNILWYLANPLKIKKMNFGSQKDKEFYYHQIATAIQNKTKYSTPMFKLNYDISFEYDGTNKAWYSEEFRGCGNGHYYLALSEEYALFYEDD